MWGQPTAVEVYLFWLEWTVRFGGMRLHTELDVLNLPTLEEQVWDCSGPIAELLETDEDRPSVYFRLLDFLKSVQADPVRPFGFESSRDRDRLSYD